LARKILLADDSVTAQNMGRKILADAGYEVITVNNGSAALKKIAEQKPDLIVLDVYMPGYSGLEVCQRLKEAQETSRVPVLLTVGKLEPFKPEEAKRARADGFIVKPFEASELLSALSKLEDKIVPRPEPSKPGRFARATAAIEEGRYDKSVAAEEDSGWKNRIAFPTKKKGKAAQEDGDDSEIYNAMNKDLRTVVERKPTEKPHEARAEETRVDLGALAPEGLPKDVTPEEIAALAAAAAQVQAKIVEAKIAESRHAEPDPSAAQTEQKAQATEPAQPAAEVPQAVTTTPLPVATFAEQKTEEKTEPRSEEKIEEKIEQKSEQNIDAPAEKSAELPKKAASIAAPSQAEVIAALAGLELDSVTSPAASGENGSWAQPAADRIADEPVTMAMAAGAASGGATSRWTAVPVAPAPEESAISLEQEMQKAYAAFAAAESAHAGFDTAPPDIQPAAAEPAAATAASSPADAVAPEPVVAVPATPAPEAAHSLSAVASAATEAISAAVQELEVVAASYLEQTAPAPEHSEPVPVENAAVAVPPAPETPPTFEASAEPTAEQSAEPRPEPSPVVAAAEPETPKLETANQDAPETPNEGQEEDQEDEESKNEASKYDAVASAAAAPEEVSSTAETRPETTAPAFVNEVPTEPAPASHIAEIAASAAGEPASAGRGEAKDESEIAADTAAAWASWRRIRESGAPEVPSSEPSPKEAEQVAPASQDVARAVAAGAEKTPEQPSAPPESEAEGIADIVDSVLADLRPKIYEEISRKMSKKK